MVPCCGTWVGILITMMCNVLQVSCCSWSMRYGMGWCEMWKNERDWENTPNWQNQCHVLTTTIVPTFMTWERNIILITFIYWAIWEHEVILVKYLPRTVSLISFLWPGDWYLSVGTWHLYTNSSAGVALLITSVAGSWNSKCPSLNLSVILPAVCGLNLEAKSSGRLLLLVSLCIFLCPIASPPSVYSHSRATLELLWPTTTTVGSSGVLVKENAASDV